MHLDPKHPLLQILVLRLPVELKSCSCFLVVDILQEEQSDLEVSPYAKKIETPFIGEDDAD